ncbi:metallophosphoesterase family protein [Pedobacter sp. AW31-3R]|uniref:metallophosphoesterase family protein n=1 Tax=Pedobacter sp. AW31-3R TaxID=3445781 RepID=UPI003FA063E7
MIKKITLLGWFAIILSGCNGIEYSPNQKFDGNTPQNVNNAEILALPQKPAGSAIKIAVSGDTQRMYKESQLFVDHINARNDVDFVILNGDISDFGLLAEFEGIYKIYSGLKVPFISVIGNHDQVANGYDVYTRMFGATNYTFTYAGIKFICHDSNSREHNFDGTIPDMGWLKNNLAMEAGIDHIIAFSHVPPTDSDFDQKLRTDYEELFNSTPGMMASIHSHQHSPDVIYRREGTGIPFIITNAVVNRAYTLIDITNGELHAQAVNF